MNIHHWIAHYQIDPHFWELLWRAWCETVDWRATQARRDAVVLADGTVIALAQKPLPVA